MDNAHTECETSGRDRERVRRARRRRAAPLPRLRRERPRGARPAGRARAGLPPRRVHVRRGPDGDHRALSARGAVHPGRARHAGLRHAPAGGPLLPHPLSRRELVRLRRRRGAPARADPRVRAARRGRVSRAGASRRADLRGGLHAPRGPAVLPRGRHAARDPGHAAARELALGARARLPLHPR